MVNVAILGFGVVGSGVAEVLATNGSHIDKKVDDLIRLKYILDVRDFPDSPFADQVIHDFSIIENDPEVNIVVETIGGAKVALDFTRRALMAGKSVVTSNKELVAEHGCELLKLAQEKGVSYLFEASVGGGIPIIRPLNQCLAANEIEEICGILNGTTNYILTRMIRAGLSFEAALKEAQQNGYAEQDPTADIEGHDACRKICILASLAFGRHVYPRQVPTEGITGVTLADVAYADACGKKIKLLGRAIHREDGKVCAYVAPHLVDGEDPLAGVEDVFNAIAVKGNAIGDVMFYGRGAGKLPTASAVVADVIDAARHKDEKKRMFWSEGGDDVAVPPTDLESVWYVRVEGRLEEVKAAFPEAALLPRAGAPENEFAFLTPKAMTRSALDASLSRLSPCSVFRVLD
uniref:homoserine dehydrogenase n=1 Tax=uncultured Flavonifractor sp. TaxID=1193534 RepID=UPI002618519D|nr:homoserine dehydrogenase [uncultured Flavonifractor sp.]